jgi:methionyl aminopeptidase
MEKEEMNGWKKIGEVAVDTMSYAKKTVRPEMTLLEISEKIENYVAKKGVSFAFPVNLCTGNIAAHYAPTQGDQTLAEGLLKLDIGLCKDGFLSDNAISIDLTPEQKHKDIIEAAEEGLKAGLKAMKHGVELRDVGKSINAAIGSKGFVPIKNLSGHSLERWKIHAGTNIPNYDNKDSEKLKEGAYAVEPFASIGDTQVTEGKPSNIFILKQMKPTRMGREVLEHIESEYKTLAFASRWLVEKFGPKALIDLSRLRQQGIIYEFPQLIKRSNEFTSQAEHSVLVLKDKTLILTQ